MIGYHWVITNCFPDFDSFKLKQPEVASDGLVHAGRSERFRGAHCADHNWESIGVCLIGRRGQFTANQLIAAAKLCTQIMDRYDYCNTVKGHHEFTDKKTCPDIEMDWFRKYILPLGRDDA
jgi:N-acetyl-anhydromuramyl-L-alanine amidase AmpD